MVALIAILAVVLAYNLTVTIPSSIAIARDERNAGVDLFAYRSWGIHPRDITLDLVAVSGDKAPLDLFRSVFLVAEAMKDRSFGRVVFARRGKPIFVMSGADFREIGQSYASAENPVYLVRTLPEKLSRPDGAPAFGTWSGGWLGVLNRQLEDVNHFAAEWAGY